jgi:hypothetical protein
MIPTSKTNSTLFFALLVTVLSACTPEQQDTGTEILLETEDDKTIYAMGVNLARNFDHLPLSKSEQEILQAGFADGMQKRDPRVDTARYGRRVENLFARRNADLARDESEAALATDRRRVPPTGSGSTITEPSATVRSSTAPSSVESRQSFP